MLELNLPHLIKTWIKVESVYLNTTLNFEILAALVFQLEVYYKVDRLLTGIAPQQIGTTTQWYSN